MAADLETQVPVERGSTYMAEEWSQQLMRLSDFIESVIEAPSGPAAALGYLAQHPLFEQIPALRADILAPDYTALGSDADVRVTDVRECMFVFVFVFVCVSSARASVTRARCRASAALTLIRQMEVPVRVNAWFGPAGTVSPLHIDATHNLLSQACRARRVLRDPEHT